MSSRYSDATSLSAQVYYYTSTLTYAFLAASASILALALMLYPTAVLRWLQRKRYQYEVTFSLYMLTPTEKFIFNSFVFLFASMIVIAASLYLPEHISFLVNRAAYYLAGETAGAPENAAGANTIFQTSVAAVKATAKAAAAAAARVADQQQDRAAAAVPANGAGMMEL
ncbi:Serine palmitoyltransferase small subunit A [Lasiodiplodia hormozganensis]|uniref:Serine palmitoyltransferase small subunit A n=1 Tax=Lasiodiplodia hormozganensis TaxID=869390 RepID=A0AA40CQX7_9PEZI|nr:Serine palmitoyltransferase small subunit A [Lasiodiplodia hormozganensis]